MADTATDARAALFAAAEPFLAAVVDHPGDALPRLAFADFLMERGADAEAAGQVWAAKHGKRPRQMTKTKGAEVFAWQIFTPRGLSCHELPMFFFREGDWWPCDALKCERYFLARCGELTWDEHGEPTP